MRVGTLIHEHILKTPCTMFPIPPVTPDEIRIEKTLFGWELLLRKEHIPCESEALARYLAAFARMGFVEVPVPKDTRVVERVAEDLEKGVAELTEYVETEISGELNPSRRQQLRELIWEGARERLEIMSASLPSK